MSLSDDKQADVIDAFNTTSRYLDDILNINNVYCGWPWMAAYININQNTHQIQVLTTPLCHAQAIFYSLPNNKWSTKFRGLTNSAK